MLNRRQFLSSAGYAAGALALNPTGALAAPPTYRPPELTAATWELYSWFRAEWRLQFGCFPVAGSVEDYLLREMAWRRSWVYDGLRDVYGERGAGRTGVGAVRNYATPSILSYCQQRRLEDADGIWKTRSS